MDYSQWNKYAMDLWNTLDNEGWEPRTIEDAEEWDIFKDFPEHSEVFFSKFNEDLEKEDKYAKEQAELFAKTPMGKVNAMVQEAYESGQYTDGDFVVYLNATDYQAFEEQQAVTSSAPIMRRELFTDPKTGHKQYTPAVIEELYMVSDFGVVIIKKK